MPPFAILANDRVSFLKGVFFSLLYFTPVQVAGSVILGKNQKKLPRQQNPGIVKQITIIEIEGIEAGRKPDETAGLNLLRFG